MPASPKDQLATMLANIPEKTGKTLDDWTNLIAASGLEKHGQVLKMLKADHGVTHGFANLIASKALESGAPEENDLIDAQYSGPKSSLRPLYEAIVAYCSELGADIEIAPKKASVSLRRNKQFALITPATKSRIDLGLALKGEAPTDRLEAYNAMCSHRVRLETPSDLDDQVKAWIKLSYDRS